MNELSAEDRQKSDILNRKANDINCQQLQYLLDTGIRFKHWYFGHFHRDITINNKFSCVFNGIYELK